MILLIDNYDSFTYNLYHYIVEARSVEVKVVRNDKISIQEIKDLKPQAIILSPGPCTPDDAGICLNIVKSLKNDFPILGVCLGHQAIGQAFGGKIIKTHPMHGKVSDIYHNSQNIFQDIPSPFKSTRYHSLIIEKESLPECLEVTANSKDNIIMGIKHKELPIYGVQFHPESVASQYGHKIIKNFIDLANAK